jgi:uncharacterized RDD family membrane protein YckC
MTGFCKDCGRPLRKDGTCPTPACGVAVATPQGHLGQRGPDRQLEVGAALPPAGGAISIVQGGIGPLPKASTPRRLIGSGVEYVAYVVCVWLIAAANLASLGGLALTALLPVGLIALRDCNAGALSIAKRISRMRVVNLRNGQPASNSQALSRNSYYLGLLLLMMVLPWFSPLWSFVFTSFVALDVLMILANPQGRRLGDMLAGTQVVEARS